MKKILIILLVAIMICMSSCDLFDQPVEEIPEKIQELHEHSWDNWELVYDDANVNLVCSLCDAKVVSYPISQGLEIENGVLVGVGTCKDEYVVVPQGVTVIGANAFSNTKNIVGVLLPQSVTKIEENAFKSCDGLKVINIPNGVTEIGDNAFHSCKELIGVLIPHSVTSIGKQAFANCGLLEIIYYVGTEDDWSAVEKGNNWNQGAGKHVVEFKMVIGENPLPEPNPSKASEGLEFKLNNDGQSYSVVGIGSCSDTHMIIPDFYNQLPVTAIGPWAFDYLNSMKKITIGNYITEIDPMAFRYCYSLEEFSISDGNPNYTAIDGNLYSKDAKIFMQYAKGKKESSFVIPEYVTRINDWAFSYCDFLKDITISDSVKSIGFYAFANCTALSNVVIPDFVKIIESQAFSTCSALEKVTIGKFVEYIYAESFDNCLLLNSIEVDVNNEHFKSVDGNLYTKDGKTLLKYATGKKDRLFSVPEDVSIIGDYAFIDSCDLEKIIIPHSVVEIGHFAFYDCTALKNIELPESVKIIGNNAFHGCCSLTEMSIPDSIIKIGFGVFDNCYNLEYKQYDNGYYLGNNNNPYLALVNIENKNITSCEMHNDTKIMANEVFGWCESLESIKLSESLINIEDNAFVYCSSLTSIIIPDSVISIGYRAFDGCTSLANVTIPNSVLSIGERAFDHCSSLVSIKIPDSVTIIDIGAFAYCSSLTSIIIPDSVRKVGERAFYGCPALTIYCEAEWEPFNWDVYWNCENLPVVWGYKPE